MLSDVSPDWSFRSSEGSSSPDQAETAVIASRFSGSLWTVRPLSDPLGKAPYDTVAASCKACSGPAKLLESF